MNAGSTIAASDAVSLFHLFPTILDAPVEDRLATAICMILLPALAALIWRAISPP